MNRPNVKSANNADGYTYLEVLVATVLLVVTLVPAMKALQNAALGSEVNAVTVTQYYRLLRLAEEVLAEPFNQLENEAVAAGSPSVATSYSDPVGSTDRRLVFLSRYDGDNADGDNDPFTGTDDGLIWVRVQRENTIQMLESLTTP